MDPFSPLPPSPPPRPPSLSDIETPLPARFPSSALWDWSDFLDFSLDDHLNISLPSYHAPGTEPDDLEGPPILNAPARIRKRDPRLTCSNFLAGRIPCSCPEIDEKLEEEEEHGFPGKKRPRTARLATRCQVPRCEADISELKGYHRRHRVCLRCANASTVVLDGQGKRYCQQCGKFHLLLDFDEGKRSCRRKLKRHSNRRRRKMIEPRVLSENEIQELGLADDAACDDENGKESICLSSHLGERELLLDSEEGQISTLCSNPDSQNIQNDDGVVSFSEAQIDGEKDEPKCARSSMSSNNKRPYTSMCPTGRISFKLYDWNPAEFPRQLRHQKIFQWLASMPVELEGYIHPGCIILTVFIAMPDFMWFKLFHDPVVSLHNFASAPGTMLSERGTSLVYLDNGNFCGNSVIQLKTKEQAPKLHYVHPTCFKAGKPMEFVACGSYLLQPKFRFLVSFAGKYLAYDFSVPPVCGDPETSFDHQLLKINIHHTEPDLFGPAFVEVENESGLSNFIPILIGSKEICTEMKIIEHNVEASLNLEGSKLMSKSSLSNPCEGFSMRQADFSQFIADTAWLLRNPALGDLKDTSTLSQIRRFSILVNIEAVVEHMKVDQYTNGFPRTDMDLLESNLDIARQILCQRFQKNGDSRLHLRNFVLKEDCSWQSSQTDMLPLVSLPNQVAETTEKDNITVFVSSFKDHGGRIPLLKGEVTRREEVIEESIRKSCSRIYTNKLTSWRLIFIIVTAVVGFAVCVVVLHPQKVGKITTTIRRCVFEKT
ncbi:hypothetical protein NMG60_11029771 [Bertholletia excelsa]